jgi:hypothetical protein
MPKQANRVTWVLAALPALLVGGGGVKAASYVIELGSVTDPTATHLRPVVAWRVERGGSAVEEETRILVLIVRRTAIICAIGGVLVTCLFECCVGDGEGVFDVLVFSPILALIGGLLGLFIGGCSVGW